MTGEIAKSITGITLLSVEEYAPIRLKTKPLRKWWWLRTAGTGKDKKRAACVVMWGTIRIYGNDVTDDDVFVRPALVLIENTHELGETFEFKGYTWTVVDSTHALCDTSFCEMPFSRDGSTNKYDESDIKKYLDTWLRK